MAAQDYFEQLRKFDTPTICNALEIVDPASRLSGFTKRPLVNPFPGNGSFIGFARTATIRATHPNEFTGAKAKEQRLGYYEYIAKGGPAPSIAVLQDLDGVDAGFGCFWGEVQSNVHKGLGGVGVITDGGIRRIPDWAQGFSLWAGLEQRVDLTWQGEPLAAVVRNEGPDRQVWRVDGAEVLAMVWRRAIFC